MKPQQTDKPDMAPRGKVLVVDDNEDILFSLNMVLKPYVEQIRVTTQPQRVEHFLQVFQPDVVMLDMNFTADTVEGTEGFELLERILRIDPQTSVIMMTAYGDTEKAVRAIKMGAVDFICKPWEKDKLIASILTAMRLKESRSEVSRMSQQLDLLSPQERTIIGESAVMQHVFRLIEQVRDTEASVLILGENGTGKDLVAAALAAPFIARKKPYISVDLGSIPENLFESELFGYEKGAFTDAKSTKSGRMELAAGGTLFLDEIGNLSLTTQAKLLTALEKKQVMRLGATAPRPVNMRLICATNADIRRMVVEGSFRQDLLYRINTVEIQIPPLRERGNDVELLAEFFLKRFSTKYKKRIVGLTREAVRKLLVYDWPGNVRELQHAIERAVILCTGTKLEANDLMLQPLPMAGMQMGGLPTLNLKELENMAIEEALKRSEGNIQRTANLLGITRFSCYRKLNKNS